MPTSFRLRARVRAATVILLLALVAVACQPQHTADGTKVLLVGNSLMHGARPFMTDELTSRGWDPEIQALSGSNISYWMPRFPFLVQGISPNVYVVELGTNDCSFDPCYPLGPYIDAIMSSIPSSVPVLWLNSQEDVPEPYNPNRGYVNDELEAADARWPNMYLVDFSGHFEDRPEWHGPDGLHLSDEGNAEFARFVADELERFRGDSTT
jgi:hypothetical protein